ncbi:MAG TPA: CDP-alcohol phosphatidyltransferase family protein [Acidimicrobiia bacterium]|nr:CDP-alcohol phosphatidyltransferase family protein [Acidimicrobiia bacterium]HZQ77214.1 CDP-alcohol phosphatidyltransferase family protein [Acidimicrobiia bacterium]
MGAQPVTRLSRRFGPSALRTPANLVTALRFALTVPLLRIIVEDGVSWRAAMGWIVLACTDGLDGWLARRDGTTRSGAFLDPLADKFLAIGGLCALATQGIFPWLAVGLITAREVGVSAYRTAAGRRGVSLPARQLGKMKTVFQLTAVGVALCPSTAEPAGLALSILWVAVGLTVVSGLDIVLAAQRGGRPATTRPGP